MSRKISADAASAARGDDALAVCACPNPDCCDFNRFAAGNLSVCEWTGKDKRIRRLYCRSCGRRFSERTGSLLQDTKLPEEMVVRLVKCLAWGCSIEATADICEVDPRTVERMLDKAGRHAEDFHQQQIRRVPQPLDAVEMDELHGRVSPPRSKKGGTRRTNQRGESRDRSLVADVAAWVARGFMPRWPSPADS